MDVLVLGCGVAGLSSAIALQSAGHRVRIWARALPPDTTSNVAGACWYPYNAFPRDKVTAWGASAYQVFKRLAASAPETETGVRLAPVFDLKAQLVTEDPWWREAVEDFRHANKDEMPTGYADAYVFTTPVIEMATYLQYLMDRFSDAGGTIITRAIASLDEATAEAPIVVNCTGLGARDLVGDRDVHAGRGQVVRVRRGALDRVLLDDDGPNAIAYIIPRISDAVLGGIDVEGDERLIPDPSVTEGILARCGRLDPRVAALTPDDILGVTCGLRPLRSSVRLEAEPVGPGRVVIHNYGHGGAGVTLSWGCAEEVARLVAEADV